MYILKSGIYFPKMLYDLILAGAILISFIYSFLSLPFYSTLLIAVNFAALWPVTKSALKALKNREVTVDLLAVVALIFAFIAGEWYSAAFINLMLTSARIFSGWTESTTEKAILSLLKYKPTTIKVQRGDEYIEKKPAEIEVGDVMLISQGERLAVDGILVDGTSSIDESTLTGESVPRNVKTGDNVYSSSLNLDGVIKVKALKKEDQSMLAKIILTVESASVQKSKTILLSNRIASFYVLFTLVGSIVLYVFSQNPNFVLSILLVVCADDLAVAIPLAYTLGIAKATKNGILVRNADVFEKLPKLKYVLTDKTGTVTENTIQISKIEKLNDDENPNIESVVKAMALGSKHPINRALASYLTESKTPKFDHFKEHPGQGLEAKLDADTYYLGNRDFIEEKGVNVSEKDGKKANEYTKKGFACTYFAKNTTLVALIIYQDKVKLDVKDAVLETKRLGVDKWIMLTGDTEEVARGVAAKAAIDEFKHSLSPTEKYEFVKKIESQGETVAMIGDGINDAPALALADVSIAMGTMGSDVAIEASDISIMNDNLEKIPQAIKLARNVRKAVIANVFFWVVTNALGLGLVLGGFLGPGGAASYNFITDILTTVNVFLFVR